jgi:hypothetical protein
MDLAFRETLPSDIEELTGKPMNWDPSLIDALFARYGVSGPWESLPSTGVANCVYAGVRVSATRFGY